MRVCLIRCRLETKPGICGKVASGDVRHAFQAQQIACARGTSPEGPASSLATESLSLDATVLPRRIPPTVEVRVWTAVWPLALIVEGSSSELESPGTASTLPLIGLDQRRRGSVRNGAYCTALPDCPRGSLLVSCPERASEHQWVGAVRASVANRLPCKGSILSLRSGLAARYQMARARVPTMAVSSEL